MTDHVLITGGAGYLGRRLAARLVEEGLRVTLHVRSRGAQELARRRQALVAEEPLLHATTMIGGDLTRRAPLGGCHPGDVTHLVHAAAITRFDVGAEEATDVNVGGTAAVLAYAQGCPRLESLLVLSSLYSTGLTPGRLAEDWLPRPVAFANEYERSKHEAEALCREAARRLPVRVLRVATVIADQPGGEVVQRGALHHALELLFAGLLAAVPGDRKTPLFVLDQPYASRACQAALLRGTPGAVYHATHGADRAPQLGQLVELGIGRARAGVQPPPYVDLSAFEALRGGAAGFAGPLLRSALDSVAPFAAQLYVHKEPDTARLDALLGGPAPDPHALAAATVAALAERRARLRSGGAA